VCQLAHDGQSHDCTDLVICMSDRSHRYGVGDLLYDSAQARHLRAGNYSDPVLFILRSAQTTGDLSADADECISV